MAANGLWGFGAPASRLLARFLGIHWRSLPSKLSYKLGLRVHSGFLYLAPSYRANLRGTTVANDGSSDLQFLWTNFVRWHKSGKLLGRDWREWKAHTISTFTQRNDEMHKWCSRPWPFSLNNLLYLTRPNLGKLIGSGRNFTEISIARQWTVSFRKFYYLTCALNYFM